MPAAAQEMSLCSSSEKTTGRVGLLLSIPTNQVIARSFRAGTIT